MHQSPPPPAVMLPCAVIEQLQRARQARRGEWAESSKRQPPSPPPLTPRPYTHTSTICLVHDAHPPHPPLHVCRGKKYRRRRRGMEWLYHSHILGRIEKLGSDVRPTSVYCVCYFSMYFLYFMKIQHTLDRSNQYDAIWQPLTSIDPALLDLFFLLQLWVAKQTEK